MSQFHPEVARRSSLRAMTGDGVAFSVMVGIGESYIAPFALALGSGDVVAGAVATAPMLVGAVLQLVTPAAVGWLGSNKRWVVLCASLQALTFVPLVLAAVSGRMAMPALWLVSDTLPWLFALQILGGVLWAAFELATLLSFFDQIPESARTSLLAVYNLAYGAAVALGTAVGGAILAYGESTPLAYAAVMAVSAGSRLVSLRLLRQVTDVPPGEMPMPRMRTLGVRPSSGALQRPVVSALDAPEDAMPARVAPTRPPRA